MLPAQAATKGKTAKPGKMAFRATVRDGLCPAILNFEQDGAKHGGALPNDAAIF